jgi:hypothetical protein
MGLEDPAGPHSSSSSSGDARAGSQHDVYFAAAMQQSMYSVALFSTAYVAQDTMA